MCFRFTLSVIGVEACVFADSLGCRKVGPGRSAVDPHAFRQPPIRNMRRIAVRKRTPASRRISPAYRGYCYCDVIWSSSAGATTRAYGFRIS